MLQHKGWWLPEGEDHQQGLIDVDYEGKKYDSIRGMLNKDGIAIDIGAHIGQWTSFMSFDFNEVRAFEPMREHAECWVKNVGLHANRNCKVTLTQTALGAFSNLAHVSCATPGNTGTTFLKLGDGNITVDFLDQLIMDHVPVSFIKLDVEGMEFDALRGAFRILTRWKPAILFEEKGHHERYGYLAGQTRQYLEKMGYKLDMVLGSDFFMRVK